MSWSVNTSAFPRTEIERVVADLRLAENQDSPNHREQLHVAKQAAMILIKNLSTITSNEKVCCSLNGYDSYDGNGSIGVALYGSV